MDASDQIKQIAEASARLLQDSDRNIGLFEDLLAFATDGDSQVAFLLDSRQNSPMAGINCFCKVCWPGSQGLRLYTQAGNVWLEACFDEAFASALRDHKSPNLDLLSCIWGSQVAYVFLEAPGNIFVKVCMDDHKEQVSANSCLKTGDF